MTVGISFGSAHSILYDDLCLSKLSAQWVPKALHSNQLNLKSELSMAILLKIKADEDRFFDQIITGDETWVYQYDPETKQHSKQWLPCGSSGPIKFKSERSVKKVMATVFWDSEGVVLEGQKTVTGTYYLEILRKLRAKLAEKHPGKLHHGILFHHDNAPVHSSRIIRDVLREFRWECCHIHLIAQTLPHLTFFYFQNSKNTRKAFILMTLMRQSKQQKHGSQNGQQITSKMG